MPTPHENVPSEVSDQLDDVLAKSLNEVNRANKRAKFCAFTSEDALTWTVFQSLLRDRAADVVLPSGVASAGTPVPLFWGAPLSAEANDLRSAFVQISEGFGERASGRSEIDVALFWPKLVCFIEVKLHSANDRAPTEDDARGRFARYWRDDLFSVDATGLARQGYYELTRNWAIGCELAKALDAAFLLINLAPERRAASFADFAETLNEGIGRRSAFLAWSDLRGRMVEANVCPDWLANFLNERLGPAGA